jgi:4'-phosphopantetheinyl transferase
LKRQEVHIWKNALDLDTGTIKKFPDILSDQETQKASRFHFDRDRRRYIAAHGHLRLILARYLGRNPKSLTFSTNQYGKPYLHSNQEDSIKLYFNMSHSLNLSVIALSLDLETGIDIEYMNRDIDIMEIAKSFFSKREIEDLNSLPENMQKYAFFRSWTRKEAYLKEKGMGLSLDLRRYGTSFLPDEPTALSSSSDFPDGIATSHLYDVPLPPSFVGALSLRDRPSIIRHFAFSS